jgi:hypothetical protein
MKSIRSVAAALAILATTAVAKTSAPFYLKAVSQNDTIDGTFFGACHEVSRQYPREAIL